MEVFNRPIRMTTKKVEKDNRKLTRSITQEVVSEPDSKLRLKQSNIETSSRLKRENSKFPLQNNNYNRRYNLLRLVISSNMIVILMINFVFISSISDLANGFSHAKSRRSLFDRYIRSHAGSNNPIEAKSVDTNVQTNNPQDLGDSRFPHHGKTAPELYHKVQEDYQITRPSKLTNRELLGRVLDDLSHAAGYNSITPIYPIAMAANHDPAEEDIIVERKPAIGGGQPALMGPNNNDLFGFVHEKHQAQQQLTREDNKRSAPGSMNNKTPQSFIDHNSAARVAYPSVNPKGVSYPMDYDDINYMNHYNGDTDYQVDLKNVSLIPRITINEPFVQYPKVTPTYLKNLISEKQQQNQDHNQRKHPLENCSIKTIHYTAEKKDSSGNRCRGTVMMNICAGSCITSEFGQERVPFIARESGTCNFHGFKKRQIKLNDCSRDAIDDQDPIRYYNFVEPIECECKICGLKNEQCLTTNGSGPAK